MSRLCVDRGTSRHSYWGRAQRITERERNAIKAKNLKRWREDCRAQAASPQFIETRKRMARYLDSWGQGYSWLLPHFRQVDGLGRSFGPRLTYLHQMRPFGRYDHQYLVADKNGNQLWLPGATRVREVAAQAEDMHSAACRIIKRAHRALINEES